MDNDFEEVELVIDSDDDEDTMMSFDDLAQDDESYDAHEEGEYDAQDGSYNNNKSDDDLRLVAFSYHDYLRDYKSGELSDSQFEKAILECIEALFELLIDFGNADSLDGLISLMVDAGAMEIESVYDSVVNGLGSFIEVETLTLVSDDYGSDSAAHITIELQEHLLSSLTETDDVPEDAYDQLITAFKANPNFSSDSRLN